SRTSRGTAQHPVSPTNSGPPVACSTWAPARPQRSATSSPSVSPAARSTRTPSAPRSLHSTTRGHRSRHQPPRRRPQPESLPPPTAPLARRRHRRSPRRRQFSHEPGRFTMPDDQESTENDQQEENEQQEEQDNNDEQQTFDAAYVKKLRDEAAKHRREAREAKARAKEYEDRD